MGIRDSKIILLPTSLGRVQHSDGASPAVSTAARRTQEGLSLFVRTIQARNRIRRGALLHYRIAVHVQHIRDAVSLHVGLQIFLRNQRQR